MRKYYVIALVAVTAIMVLLVSNIKSRYENYIQEVSQLIDKALDIAMEDELAIRMNNIRLNDMPGPMIGIRLHRIDQQTLDSIYNLPQVKDGTYKVNIIDGREERAAGMPEIEITRLYDQDRYIRHHIFIDMPNFDSIFNYRLGKAIPHRFTLLDHDTVVVEPYGDRDFSHGSYDKLKRVGLKEKQALRVEADIPVREFMQAEVMPLSLSALLVVVALSCVLLQLTIIRRKEQTLHQRDVTTVGIIHDMKGPVGTAVSIANSFHSFTDDPEVQEIIQHNETMLKHTLHKVEALEDTLYEEQSHCNVNRKPTDLQSLTETVKEEIDVVFLSKQHTVNIINELPDGKLVDVDADKVERILRNLIENSVKYADAGVEVNVRIFEQEGVTTLSVADNGWGIAPEHLKKIFRQYYRIEQPDGCYRKGHGLGLANVQQLVKAHGGVITVQSEIGKGSVLTFTLS